MARQMNPDAQAPNILITGTPGTGKSTLGRELSERSGLNYINVGDLAKDNDCFEGFDKEYNCGVLDEDRLLDEMEDIMQQGGNIVDFHGCELFPQRWFDVIFVLRCDNKVLYDRLEARGYSGKKLSDNMECEIMQTILEEARDSYDPEIVHELASDTPDHLEQNLTRIEQWIKLWQQQHCNT